MSSSRETKAISLEGERLIKKINEDSQKILDELTKLSRFLNIYKSNRSREDKQSEFLGQKSKLNIMFYNIEHLIEQIPQKDKRDACKQILDDFNEIFNKLSRQYEGVKQLSIREEKVDKFSVEADKIIKVLSDEKTKEAYFGDRKEDGKPREKFVSYFFEGKQMEVKETDQVRLDRLLAEKLQKEFNAQDRIEHKTTSFTKR